MQLSTNSSTKSADNTNHADMIVTKSNLLEVIFKVENNIHTFSSSGVTVVFLLISFYDYSS